MILIYTPKDLRREAQGKTYEDIGYTDIIFSREPMQLADFSIYMENNERWKVLKNRHRMDSPQTKEILNLIGINV